jgi:hypothetical protein
MWDSASALAKKFRYAEAVALYRGVESDMRRIDEWRPERKIRDNRFDQALFFSDYFGALADAGLYAEAEEIGAGRRQSRAKVPQNV